jgi:hypothetical protein
MSWKLKVYTRSVFKLLNERGHDLVHVNRRTYLRIYTRRVKLLATDKASTRLKAMQLR